MFHMYCMTVRTCMLSSQLNTSLYPLVPLDMNAIG